MKLRIVAIIWPDWSLVGSDGPNFSAIKKSKSSSSSSSSSSSVRERERGEGNGNVAKEGLMSGRQNLTD